MASKKKIEEPVIVEDIRPTTLDELMGDRFGIYAKDVIQDRAIPDARDGLKPVQRRIIYGMYETGNTIDKPTIKCAKIVGHVMGIYHPHGDSSIYEALVRMSQYWRVRLPLIDFQGNNGSMDGDGPAAYRYTEARLAALAGELVKDIDKETVDMELTFDDTELEPVVLPSRFPNLLVNGAEGIAVGMATAIPPHNLKEISQAVIYRLKHPTCPVEKLMEFVQGPDFPTGGIVYKSQGLEDIYKTGRGRIEVASKTEIIESSNQKQIIVTEIPYGVNKSDLVKEIDTIRHDKTIPGIDEVRDETDKNGLRIAIDLKQDSKPEAILTYLMSKTKLRSSYSANMVCIVEGRPKLINLESYCDTYIAHQESVITRRSKFELSKNQIRLNIVEGLIKAASLINEVIEIIRASKDKADSKKNLEEKLGFNPEQSEAIVMMPLFKLSHTDAVALENEKDALIEQAKQLHMILENHDVLLDVIEKDLKQIIKIYGDERRTSIEEDDGSLRTVNKRDLVAQETVMVAATRDGYIKRSSMASWKGSGGNNGALPGLKGGDSLVYCGKADTTDFMVFFTTKGNYLYIPVHLLKTAKWLEEGQHVNYAINLTPNDKIIRGFVVRHFRSDLYFAILSRRGQIKRVRLKDLEVIRYNRPIRAMKLLGGDEIADVVLTNGNNNLMLFSEDGLAVCYNENEVPLASTNSGGVKAARFGGSECAALLSFDQEENGKILLLTNFAHTRVLESSKVALGARLSKPTTVYKSFKSEPHQLIYARKVDGREPPIKLIARLNNGEYLEITWEDVYLTPMDKYAKKTDNRLAKKNPIKTVHYMDENLIDDSIKSYPLPVKEVPDSEESEAEPGEIVPIESISEQSSDEPAEKFEQISIFDDDFE